MRKHAITHTLLAALTALLLAGAGRNADADDGVLPSTMVFDNELGVDATISSAGAVNLSNPFFQSLGGNGRACVSCHQPSAGWTVTPRNVRARFDVDLEQEPVCL